MPIFCSMDYMLRKVAEHLRQLQFTPERKLPGGGLVFRGAEYRVLNQSQKVRELAYGIECGTTVKVTIRGKLESYLSSVGKPLSVVVSDEEGNRHIVPFKSIEKGGNR